MRVHEFARHLEIPSKDVLNLARSIGVFARSAATTLTEFDQQRIRSARAKQAVAPSVPRHLPAGTAGSKPRPPMPRPATRHPAAVSTVRVNSLSPMAQAILPPHLAERRTIPQNVADHLNDQALAWAREGFDYKTVRPWQRSRISPEAAGYLAARSVDPAVLELPIEIRRDLPEVSLAMAIKVFDFPVERAYGLLVTTGLHTPVPVPQLELPVPSVVKEARPAPPVVFSSPGADGPEVGSPTSRRRQTGRRRQAGGGPHGRRSA